MIRLAKEPQGRLRFLTEDEIARLLRACDKPQSPFLHAIVCAFRPIVVTRIGASWSAGSVDRGH